MNQTDIGPLSESRVETARAAVERGREYAAKTTPYLRRGVESNAALASVGATALLAGLRALRGGKRKRGLTQLSFGAALLATALTRRRSRRRDGASDVEESDVVDTGPDVGSVADESGGGDEAHAAGDEAAAVADTSPDVEAASSGLDSESESESDADAASASVDQREVADTGVGDFAEGSEGEAGDAGAEREAGDGTTDAEGVGAAGADLEDADRLGKAAFNRQSREVPAPQQAFNRGFLAHSAEAFWGIRTDDDAVLVSQDFDAVEGRDGVRYIASSEIGEDVRELPIPDAILKHWDVAGDGGTAIAGGDDVLFVTTDDLAADGVLCVLPAAWADDASE